MGPGPGRRIDGDRASTTGSFDLAALAQARRRAEAFLTALSRLGADDYERLAISPDDGARAGARTMARQAARAAGLGTLVDDTVDQARASVEAAYVRDGYQPTMFGLNWGVSTGRTADRVAVVEAVEDAAVAVVVGPLVPIEVGEALRESFEAVASLRPGAGGSPADPPDGGRRAGQRHRWRIALSLLVAVAILPSIAYAAATAGLLAVAVPIVMIVVIIALAARSAGRA